MTVTKEQAVLAGEFHTIFHDRQGRKWRSNGRCKTWPDPQRKGHFKLPIKRGVPGISKEEDNGFGYITHLNRDDFHLPGRCKCDLVNGRLNKTDLVDHATRTINLDKSHPGWDEAD